MDKCWIYSIVLSNTDMNQIEKNIRERTRVHLFSIHIRNIYKYEYPYYKFSGCECYPFLFSIPMRHNPHVGPDHLGLGRQRRA
jgi:hypothetical protein